MDLKNFPGPGAGEGQAGLYVHIPFCFSKCPYCSFNSLPCGSHGPSAGYLDAVRGQAGMTAAAWGRETKFASLFIGGGTPTVYGPEDLAGLLATCLDTFRFEGPEISLEANPNSVDFEKLRILRQAGVNRLSLGVQSFSDRLLKRLGRSHSTAEAMSAFGRARQAGFTNINLDLMYGLPGQGVEEWRRTLEKALDLEPEHLALYELTIEEKTPFDRQKELGKIVLPAEEQVLEMAAWTGELLGRAGFVRYEISNYARPGFECRHNINYWENGTYLGLGAGAVSCLAGTRIRNVADPEEFVSLVAKGRQPFGEAECLPREDRFRETVIMGLRMLNGISATSLRERFGLELSEYYGTTLSQLLTTGLLVFNGDRLSLTKKGLPVANQVLARLV